MNFIKVSLLLLLPCMTLICQINTPGSKTGSDIKLLKKHTQVLGSDLFEGRGTGTKGGELAANYIAGVYKEIGLKPVGNEGTYFQDVPLHGASFLEESKLSLCTKNDTIDLKIGADYLLTNSGEQTIIPSKVELVFVGYGIIAPEFDHNDYLDKEVDGKIAVMLSGEPESGDSEYFNGDEPTIYYHSDVKHRLAISRGAAGTIIIPIVNTNYDQYWERMRLDYSFEDVKLSYNASYRFGIILNPELADSLFLRGNNGTKSEHPAYSTEGYALSFEGDFFVRDFKAYNVVGLLESAGSRNNDEYIIVSAHYDHLGIGPEINGDQIYNGVLDNALGVSSMLEVARTLNEKRESLNRSILFIAVTGEEKGLLGSTYYTDHPIFPLYKTAANINIDGIAFFDEFRSVIGVGAELSSLGGYLQETSAEYNFTHAKIPKEFYAFEAFTRSDQMAFAKAGIPSILILDGPDYLSIERSQAIKSIIYYNEKIYHTPFDDLSININYKAVKLHTDFYSDFIIKLAEATKSIKWNNNVPYNYIRLQTIAEKR